jgi:hypothetical protein
MGAEATAPEAAQEKAQPTQLKVVPSGHTMLALFVLLMVLAPWAALAYVAWAWFTAPPQKDATAAVLSAVERAVEACNGSNLALAKELRERIASAENAIRGELKAELSEVKGELARLKPEVKSVERPRAYLPRDTVLCVLNSQKVEYNAVLRPAIHQLFKEHAARKLPASRLALVVAVDQKPTTLVGLGEGKTAEKDFNHDFTSGPHIAESPGDTLAEGLAALFTGPDDGRERRLVLIASSDCRAPGELVGEGKMEGWKKLQALHARVDVVLLRAPEKGAGKDLPRALGERAQGWAVFCADREGFVHLLPRPANSEKLTEVVLGRLREITAPTEKRR